MKKTPPQLDPSELLHYLPESKVVICIRCRYAIQPNAISRHLKDLHRIYRSSRRPFMKYVSTLSLDEPQVVNAKIHMFPVPILPIEDGLACNSCKYMCISTKRMKNHWSTVHGRPGDSHPVRLQTFFRGKDLHYFTTVSSLVEPESIQV